MAILPFEEAKLTGGTVYISWAQFMLSELMKTVFLKSKEYRKLEFKSEIQASKSSVII